MGKIFSDSEHGMKKTKAGRAFREVHHEIAKVSRGLVHHEIARVS